MQCDINCVIGALLFKALFTFKNAYDKLYLELFGN